MIKCFEGIAVAFWVTLITVFVIGLAIYDGQKDLPRRACIDGTLYIHHSDGVYVKSNQECIK